MAPAARNSRSKTAQRDEPPGSSGTPGSASGALAVQPTAPPRPPDPNRTGVVFVHGIGDQAACGTFLDWSRPIVDLLVDWRRDHEAPGDPVVRCTYDQTSAQLPYLDLEINDYAGHPAGSWVITEAWWAQSTRPPTLPAMTHYIRTIGQWGPGVAVVGLAFLVLARVGTGFWGSWDRRERQAAHQKTPQRPSRIVPAIEFGLLTVIGVEMAVATLAWLWR